MCGRYTLYHDEEDLTALFEIDVFPIDPRYNVAPTQAAPIVRARAVVGRRDDVRERLDARWGLLPTWVRDPDAFKTLLFNARSESAAEKPSFRDAIRQGRCAVPATGFYEWAKRDGSKQPHHIRRRDGAPMILAGLYGMHVTAGPTFTILTTRPNEEVAALHDRMPVVLEPDDLERWLDPGLTDAAGVSDLLRPLRSGELETYPVGKAVGNARLDTPELVRPL